LRFRTICKCDQEPARVGVHNTNKLAENVTYKKKNNPRIISSNNKLLKQSGLLNIYLKSITFKF